MDISAVKMEIPEGANLIVGQSHFIKSAEDLYEAMTGTAPAAQFGLAFSEASGPCLVRLEGNDAELIEAAMKNSLSLGCGHTFVVLMRGAFPINVLNAIKAVPEVCGIFCATANPVEVIVAATALGRGILGVVDGSSPKGVESEKDVAERRSLLRRFGYKL
ncbi:MAG: Adenosine specific kinase [Methanosaeta sp. PtaB.Bin039]|nr:MAG: Adenosine specific kinase [Methanosaeta sp. PtaB.Bin039]